MGRPRKFPVGAPCQASPDCQKPIRAKGLCNSHYHHQRWLTEPAYREGKTNAMRHLRERRKKEGLCWDCGQTLAVLRRYVGETLIYQVTDPFRCEKHYLDQIEYRRKRKEKWNQVMENPQ